MANRIVYHYTNIHGLMGILSNLEIWASAASHLNDRLEFSFFYRYLNKEINRAVGNGEKLVIDLLWDAIPKSEIFVTSFSHTDNSASQWERYADRGYGYAIELNLDHILSEHHHYESGHLFSDEYNNPTDFLIDVQYGERNAERAAKQMINDPAYRQMLLEAYETGKLDFTVFSHALTFKHDSFSDERETRLILPKERFKKLYRAGTDGKIVPYVKFKISSKAINRVCVGPCLDQKLTRLTLLDYIHSLGENPDPRFNPYGHIKVYCSEVPLQNTE